MTHNYLYIRHILIGLFFSLYFTVSCHMHDAFAGDTRTACTHQALNVPTSLPHMSQYTIKKTAVALRTNDAASLPALLQKSIKEAFQEKQNTAAVTTEETRPLGRSKAYIHVTLSIGLIVMLFFSVPFFFFYLALGALLSGLNALLFYSAAIYMVASTFKFILIWYNRSNSETKKQQPTSFPAILHMVTNLTLITTLIFIFFGAMQSVAWGLLISLFVVPFLAMLYIAVASLLNPISRTNLFLKLWSISFFLSIFFIPLGIFIWNIASDKREDQHVFGKKNVILYPFDVQEQFLLHTKLPDTIQSGKPYIVSREDYKAAYKIYLTKARAMGVSLCFLLLFICLFLLGILPYSLFFAFVIVTTGSTIYLYKRAKTAMVFHLLKAREKGIQEISINEYIPNMSHIEKSMPDAHDSELTALRQQEKEIKQKIMVLYKQKKNVIRSTNPALPNDQLKSQAKKKLKKDPVYLALKQQHNNIQHQIGDEHDALLYSVDNLSSVIKAVKEKQPLAAIINLSEIGLLSTEELEALLVLELVASENWNALWASKSGNQEAVLAHIPLAKKPLINTLYEHIQTAGKSA